MGLEDFKNYVKEQVEKTLGEKVSEKKAWELFKTISLAPVNFLLSNKKNKLAIRGIGTYKITALASRKRRSASDYVYHPSTRIDRMVKTAIPQGNSVFEHHPSKYIKRLIEDSLKDLIKLYRPTRDERELIARAMDKFIRNGYMISALPPIYLSFETPPLFVAYPELEEEFEKELREEEYIPRNRDRRRPELISIEKVAGLYIPDDKYIILYKKGIQWWARKRNLDEDLLRGIVLLHEIGHWITHLLPKPGIPAWSTKLYKLTSDKVHEGWAQLITWWVVDEIGGPIRYVFEDSNKVQTSLYHVYKNFTDKPIRSVISSLDKLRLLRWPATLYDWEFLISNNEYLTI